MHTIEPHFKWRLEYVASEDKYSPFFGREYSEFEFSQKIYNYYIHPQWDDFGSETMYCKILYTDYIESYTIIELIGEWNDCIHNDVMLLKQAVVDPLVSEGVHKFIFIGENVLNYHSSDDCYYEEWYEDISEEGGWIAFVNFLEHVTDEMKEIGLQHYINMEYNLADVIWRPQKPQNLFWDIQNRVEGQYIE